MGKRESEIKAGPHKLFGRRRLGPQAKGPTRKMFTYERLFLPPWGGRAHPESGRVTPEEIIRCLSRMTDPYKVSDPDDSARALARLVREARATLSPRRQRREAWLYQRETRPFSSALLLVQQAPSDELRLFVMRVVDILWGEGSGEAGRGARRLDFDKEWDCPDFLSVIANLIFEASFNPFPGGE